MKRSLASLSLTLLVCASCAEKQIRDEVILAPLTPREMKVPVATEPVELVFDKNISSSKPVNFRSRKDLRMSASAQLNPRSIKAIAQVAKKEKASLTVFDLRQESHGLINDKPVTWYAEKIWANAGLGREEVLRKESRLLGDMRIGTEVGTEKVRSIETAESMVRGSGHQYVRLTVAAHSRPSDADVDRFIVALRELPERAWVHFYGKDGGYRATTFMVLYDMLLSAQYLPFDEIIARQQKLFPKVNLLQINKPEDWQTPYQEDMAEFLRKFYEYAKAHPRGEDMYWSHWLRR